MNIKRSLIKYISNLPGWSTKRKIVVIESDDWGSIRMPSRKTFEVLKAKGLDLTSGDAARYNLNDTLATPEDLVALFEVLQSVKDKNGKPAVFNPCCVVANPDFEKIKDSGFQKYFYEPFTETLKRYRYEDAFQLWQQGLAERLFVPEFHGREHLNVQVWLRALQNNDPHTLMAFEHGMWGFRNNNPLRITYQAAFDLEFPEDIEYQKTVITEGLDLFEHLHGYKASLLVPPNGSFNSQLEEPAYNNGIHFISKSKIQREPLGKGNMEKKYYWNGKMNKFEQLYMTRNVAFEPNYPGRNWIDSSFNDIKIAFQFHKPAIITTHRVNYIGAINPENRKSGLLQLKTLLNKIVKMWPDVEFMTSSELGNQIFESKGK